MNLQSKLGKTILSITHDLDEALKLGDRIAIMKEGQIVQIGTSEEILENPANEYVSKFVRDVDRSKVLKASNVMKKPEVLMTQKGWSEVVVRRMEEIGASSIFVVDEDNNLKGLLTVDDAIKAYKEDILVEEFLIGRLVSDISRYAIKRAY